MLEHDSHEERRRTVVSLFSTVYDPPFPEAVLAEALALETFTNLARDVRLAAIYFRCRGKSVAQLSVVHDFDLLIWYRTREVSCTCRRTDEWHTVECNVIREREAYREALKAKIETFLAPRRGVRL